MQTYTGSSILHSVTGLNVALLIFQQKQNDALLGKLPFTLGIYSGVLLLSVCLWRKLWFSQGTELKRPRPVQLQDCQELSGYGVCAHQFALIMKSHVALHVMNVMKWYPLTTIIFSRRAFWSVSTFGQGCYFRPPKSNPNRLKISSAFFRWKKKN